MSSRADRRLRVLWLIKGLGPGGAEHLLVSQARTRNRARFDVHCAYLLPWKSQLVAALSAEEIPVHCLSATRRSLDLRWMLRLRGLLTQTRYDIVHVHSPMVAGLARLVALTIPARIRPRFISTEHVPWSGYAWPTRILNALTFDHDAAHIAVSPMVAKSIPPRHRVTTIVHGVVLEQVRSSASYRSEIRRELGIANDEVLIGTVANLRAQKAYPDLLIAAKTVLDRHDRAHFVAVGQGPLEREIRRMHASLGLGERFRLLGYRADAAAVLGACDIFVLASLYEGFPIAVMEAMAIGLPIVSTAVGGLPDAVSDGVEGLLLPPSRPDLLAKALDELVGDDGRRARMSRAARLKADSFDIRQAVERIEDIYEAVAAGSPPTGLTGES